MSAEEKYPLPDKERRMLENELLASDTALVLVGIVLSLILSGVSSGDWLRSVVYFGWSYDLGQTLVLARPMRDVLIMLAVPALYLAVDFVFERIAWNRWETFRADVYATRAGLNGELPRLPLSFIAVSMAFVGFAEEFVFRYCALGLLYQIFALFLVGPWALVCAVVISSALFAFVHAQYASVWERASVALIGVVQAAVFLLTGSLIVVSVTHALYDFVALLLERRRMVRDDDYFGPHEPPTAAIEELTDMIARGYRDHGEDADRRDGSGSDGSDRDDDSDRDDGNDHGRSSRR